MDGSKRSKDVDERFKDVDNRLKDVDERSKGNLKVLYDRINDHIKDFQGLYVGLATALVSIAVGGLAIQSANIQANAAIQVAEAQAKATLTAERKTILNEYIERVKDVLDDKGSIDVKKELIQAKSFAALRILDGQGKGYVVRFLNEYHLIANQPKISLSGADLTQINLHDAWLPDINLKGAYLSGGILHNTSLKRANLAGTDLKNADLTGANLEGANLKSANLEGANLTGANLKGAKFCNTILQSRNSVCP